MKKPTYTIAALVLASASLALTAGWLLNRQTAGDWFEESGLLINLAVTIAAVTFAVAALLRAEPKRILALTSLLLATPSILLGMRILIFIGRFMYSGDT